MHAVAFLRTQLVTMYPLVCTDAYEATGLCPYGRKLPLEDHSLALKDTRLERLATRSVVPVILLLPRKQGETQCEIVSSIYSTEIIKPPRHNPGRHL
jgi:hypothetical protein